MLYRVILSVREICVERDSLQISNIKMMNVANIEAKETQKQHRSFPRLHSASIDEIPSIFYKTFVEDLQNSLDIEVKILN